MGPTGLHCPSPDSAGVTIGVIGGGGDNKGLGNVVVVAFCEMVGFVVWGVSGINPGAGLPPTGG